MSKNSSTYSNWFHDSDHAWQEPWSVIDATTDNVLFIYYIDRNETRHFWVDDTTYARYAMENFDSRPRRASEMPKWAAFERIVPTSSELMNELTTDQLDDLGYSLPIIRAYVQCGGHLGNGWILALLDKIEALDLDLDQAKNDLRWKSEMTERYE